jgi:hypothetical protein
VLGLGAGDGGGQRDEPLVGLGEAARDGVLSLGGADQPGGHVQPGDAQGAQQQGACQGADGHDLRHQQGQHDGSGSGEGNSGAGGHDAPPLTVAMRAPKAVKATVSGQTRSGPVMTAESAIPISRA